MRARISWSARDGTRLRGTLDVLVPQADSLGTVAVIRSLGRGGYRVHAASTRRDALGLRSRFAHRAVVSPPYSHSDYVPWLREYLREHRVFAIVPSEAFLLALGAARVEFLPLIPFVPNERAMLDAMSKYALLENLLARAAPHLPLTLLLRDLHVPPSERELDRLRPPLYVKVDGCFSVDGSPGATLSANSAAEARAILLRLRHSFSRAVVQGYVPGQGVGAFFLCARGRILAELMHRRLHEVPYTGGVSSLRETWHHAAILEDAREKLRAADWEGVAMMEYRWESASDRFAFIEMNARFWGSLHLALYAGVDFPRLLLDAWQGLPVAPPRPRLGMRCRHLPGEVRHLWSKLKSRELGVGAKLAAAAEFAALTFDPRVRSDLWFPGDTGLFWTGLRQLHESVKRRRRSRPTLAGMAPPPESPADRRRRCAAS